MIHRGSREVAPGCGSAVTPINMVKKRKLFPIDKKRLLPKDIELLEWLDRGGRPGGDEDFEKLLDRVAHTRGGTSAAASWGHKKT